jgi:hypothetical protein
VIITHTPLRISFAGGGKDFREFWQEHGGAYPFPPKVYPPSVWRACPPVVWRACPPLFWRALLGKKLTVFLQSGLEWFN